MPNQKADKGFGLYKFLFWGLLTLLIAKYLLDSVAGGVAGADELVIKQKVKGGAWVYVTRYGAPATDLDTLRFYISDLIHGGDLDILKQLNEKPPFMVTDSNARDVVIHDNDGGVAIEVNGAVYSYYSKRYTEGAGFKSYRISLNQRDTRH